MSTDKIETSTYEAIHAAVDAAEAAGLLAPKVDVNWFDVSQQLAVSIVEAFPDRDWSPHAHNGSEWVDTRGPVNLTVFLPDPAPRPKPAARGEAILTAAQPDAVSA